MNCFLPPCPACSRWGFSLESSLNIPLAYAVATASIAAARKYTKSKCTKAKPKDSATGCIRATVRKTRGTDLNLSPRQSQIMRLVCSGKANKQIAGCLGIAENTVKNHMKKIFRRLKCSCRAHAVAKFIQPATWQD
jgi:DNA-binding NarL/FixJ family response regulator